MMWLAKSQSLRHWKTARFSSLFCSLTSSKCTLWWFYQKERGVSQVHVYALVVMYVVRLGLCVVNQLTHTSFLSLCCMLPYVITLLVFLSSVLCVWLWLLLSGVLSGGWFCRQHTIIPFHMLKCCDLSDNGVAAEDQTLFSSVWSSLLWMLDIMYIKMALCLGKYIWLALKIELHFSSVYTLLFTGFLGLWSGSMEADIYMVFCMVYWNMENIHVLQAVRLTSAPPAVLEASRAVELWPTTPQGKRTSFHTGEV